MGTGLMIDFFFAGMIFLVVETINHGQLSSSASEAQQTYDYTDFQSFTVVAKFALILDVVIESVIYFVEMFYFNKFRTRKTLQKRSFKMSEKNLRKMFGLPYALGNFVWFVLLAFAVLFLVTFDTAQICRIDQTQSAMSDQVCLDCAVPNCLTCSKSGTTGCDVCQKGFFL